MAVDNDLNNIECLEQVVIAQTSYFFMKYVVIMLALTMPVIINLRIKAQSACNSRKLEASSFWCKSYMLLLFYCVLLVVAIIFMESSAATYNNSFELESFNVNQVYAAYLVILLIYIVVRDFHHYFCVSERFAILRVSQWRWTPFLIEFLFLGTGALFIPIMGSWTLYRCYNLTDSIGRLVFSASYFAWSGIMICFFDPKGFSKSSKLKLLKAESYMLLLFGITFMMYYSIYSGGGIFRSYIHKNDNPSANWIEDQQQTIISMCWILTGFISYISVTLGYASSFHYLMTAPPLIMTMFNQASLCHRTDLAHKMHGLIFLGSLLFRAFDKIHEAAALMFLAALTFVSSANCLVVWSIKNQVAEMYVFMILCTGLFYWTYLLYTFRDHLFDLKELNPALKSEDENPGYSKLNSLMALEEFPSVEDIDSVSLSP